MARERGVSFSGLVNLALSNLQTQEKISEAEQQIPSLLEHLSDFLSILNERLEKIEKQTAKIENWSRYVAYQSTLATQLIKAKLNNYLKLNKEQYQQFKQLWPQLHENVQQVIEELTGQRVEPFED